MTPERLKALREEFLTHEARFPVWKRIDRLPPNVDMLGFYREVAKLRQTPAEVYFAYYLVGQVQSIARAVKTGKYTWSWDWAWETGDAGLKQRIADVRHDLLLLAALLEEKNDNEVGGRG